MGLGHLGASFAIRGRFPRIPLFFLLLAAVFVDVLWGFTILTGIEHARISAERGSVIPLVLEDVPYTHSLVACLLWAAMAGGAWWLWRRDRAGAIVLAALVVSHWVLDYVSHVDDVPLLPAGPMLGLGLWRSRVASLIVELGMLGAGIALYAASTRARDRIGAFGLPIYAAVLVVVGAGAFLGPPPPSIVPMATGSIVIIVPLLLLQWVDGHRLVRSTEQQASRR